MKKILTAVLLAAVAPAVASDPSPQDWMKRMSRAVQTLSYEGTVVRLANGDASSMKVAHTIRDGVIHERVVAQEGTGFEVVRTGNKVRHILPDKKVVWTEDWNDRSTVFSTLPTSELEIGNEYTLQIKREDRVAGREAVVLAIQPHDAYRYGHRLWLDTETGFLLKTELLGEDGQPLEAVKFVEIRLDQEPDAASFSSSHALDGYSWFSKPGKSRRKGVDASWVATDLPAGFRVVASEEEALSDAGTPVLHILYSDGLASVSAFIVDADGDADRVRKKAELESSRNSYSVVQNQHRVTVVGEVPAATVKRIAESLEQRPGH